MFKICMKYLIENGREGIQIEEIGFVIDEWTHNKEKSVKLKENMIYKNKIEKQKFITKEKEVKEIIPLTIAIEDEIFIKMQTQENLIKIKQKYNINNIDIGIMQWKPL